MENDMDAQKLKDLAEGQVVLDNSGTAMQKQLDGTWQSVSASVPNGALEGIGPFSRLGFDRTQWEFPPQVEIVLDKYEGTTEEATAVVEAVREAQAEANFLGTYPLPDTAVDTLDQAVRLIESMMEDQPEGRVEGMKYAITLLSRFARKPHDDY